MKKILFLGAGAHQLPPILYALEQQHHVITCDMDMTKLGHELAHEAYPVSTTDREGILALSRHLNIDGIVAYAADSAAPTAAYVAEQMGLPGNPYQAALTLTRKDKFRAFLADNGFNTPKSNSFEDINDARVWLEQLKLPVFVKPVDASGNRGISFIDAVDQLDAAFGYALSFSRIKKVVLEERIEKVGYQIDSDVFMLDGKLKFWLWADAHFDPAWMPPAPAANSYPTLLDSNIGLKAAGELERLLRLLDCRIGPFNVEYLVDAKGEIWFLEVGPRNGGDGIPDVIKHATGVDLVKYTVDAALGLECATLQQVAPSGFWSNYIIRAKENCRLVHIEMSRQLESKIISRHMWVRPGEPVSAPLGILILRFDSSEEMHNMLSRMPEHLAIETTPLQGVSTARSADGTVIE
ncbi:carbamoyl-phosphate-synthetase [Halomonas sp. LR3S48]|uniref:ATP-grasp domain-containing protein n=1 Tax=Halomonadaceae TaxID=28256 RepID=UPI0021E48F70|nr:carbamoyl-phosphate-synthetase [Halomonas sp. LR3S48]UYG02153.1 carbamoyl-phosphate-synthetase [Halomonas sp. LR3S48]